MEIDSSTFLAVVFGMLLVLLFIAIATVVFRAILRKPARSAPLIPTEGGHFEVAGKRVSCSHCGGPSSLSSVIIPQSAKPVLSWSLAWGRHPRARYCAGQQSCAFSATQTTPTVSRPKG